MMNFSCTAFYLLLYVPLICVSCSGSEDPGDTNPQATYSISVTDGPLNGLSFSGTADIQNYTTGYYQANGSPEKALVFTMNHNGLDVLSSVWLDGNDAPLALGADIDDFSWIRLIFTESGEQQMYITQSGSCTVTDLVLAPSGNTTLEYKGEAAYTLTFDGWFRKDAVEEVLIRVSGTIEVQVSQ